MNWWQENKWLARVIVILLVAIFYFILGIQIKKCTTCPETERIYISYHINEPDTSNVVIDSVITRVRPYLKLYYYPKFETLKYPTGGQVEKNYYFTEGKIQLKNITITYPVWLDNGSWMKSDDDSVWYPSR